MLKEDSRTKGTGMKSASMVLVSLLVLAGCNAVAGPGSEPRDTIAAREVARPAPAAKGVRVETRSLPSALLSRDVKYHLYLPQSYDAEAPRSYPVIYWLHGSGGYPPGIVAMLAGRFHEAMVNRRMPEALVVFPDGFEDTMWMNARDGSMPVEDFFVGEFIPHMDATYRTQTNRAGRVLEGASMGGYGAARFAFLHPELFMAVSMINPGPMQEILDPENAPIVGREAAQALLDDIYGGDPAYFAAQSPWTLAADYAARRRYPLKVRIILGESDAITPTNRVFSERLRELGVEHQLVTVSGAGHNPREMFSRIGADYWKFFGEAFQAGRTNAIDRK